MSEYTDPHGYPQVYTQCYCVYIFNDNVYIWMLSNLTDSDRSGGPLETKMPVLIFFFFFCPSSALHVKQISLKRIMCGACPGPPNWGNFSLPMQCSHLFFFLTLTCLHPCLSNGLVCGLLLQVGWWAFTKYRSRGQDRNSRALLLYSWMINNHPQKYTSVTAKKHVLCDKLVKQPNTALGCSKSLL